MEQESHMPGLAGKRILMFVADTYEDQELWYPKYRLEEEGAVVTLAGPEGQTVYMSKHGYPCMSDVAADDLKADDFDMLVIPGGFAPDKLRRLDSVKRLTRDIHEAGKLVAHICHGGWIPISAGIMDGFDCTSTPGIKDDLVNAGASWFDKDVVVDRNQVSSRKPDDLPAFMRAIIELARKL
jgi:protease I